MPVRDRERSRHRARASSVATRSRTRNFAPGAFFGELALARDVSRRDCHRARDVTRTLSIDGAAFRATLKGALGAERDALALTLADARAAELRASRVRDEARFRERDPGVVRAWSRDPGAGEVETTRSDPDAIFEPTTRIGHSRTVSESRAGAGADGRLGRRRRGRGRERRGWDERRGGRRRRKPSGNRRTGT